MPSTLVHVALAALLGAALVPDRYLDGRGLAIVAAMAVVPDLDVFGGFVIPGAHRSLGHTLFVPATVGTVLVLDARREGSFLRRRVGDGRVAALAVGVVGMTLSSIGLDYATNGVNLFWPVHDEFFRLNGRAILSNQRGLVQTFLDLSPPDPDGNGGGTTRTTENTHYRTGIDPSPGDEPANVERVFPLATAGWQVLLIVTSVVVCSARLYRVR